MKNVEITTTTGDKHWISRSVAVAGFVFVRHNGITYILANKRGVGVPNHQGLWNCPCGYLDWDETTKEGCAREIYEESGIRVQPGDLVFQDVDDNPNKEEQNITFRYSYFNIVNKLPQTTDAFSEYEEIADIKWIPIVDVHLYNWAFKHDEIIMNILENW